MPANGARLNAAVVADYAVLGVLAAAKRFDEVARRHDRHVWSGDAPVQPVTGATRSGRDGSLAADGWRARLGEQDWVILTAPATGDTHAAIGAAELAAMKPTASLVNIARGDLVDQAALREALVAGRIGGAFLDTVTPEPLPADGPLWSAPNCIVTMHLSGRGQTSLAGRGGPVPRQPRRLPRGRADAQRRRPRRRLSRRGLFKCLPASRATTVRAERSRSTCREPWRFDDAQRERRGEPLGKPA